MDLRLRKLHFIRKIWSLSNETVMDELENLLKREQSKGENKVSAYDFLGVISEEEAEAMEKEIAACCDHVNEKDWK